MTVDKLGDNKLLIKLDESDMENFELDFGKMSFKNEDNQKVIIGLMRLACCRAGLDTNGKNVKIEAFCSAMNVVSLLRQIRKNENTG